MATLLKDDHSEDRISDVNVELAEKLEAAGHRTSYNGASFTVQDGKNARRRVDFFLVSTLCGFQ